MRLIAGLTKQHTNHAIVLSTCQTALHCVLQWAALQICNHNIWQTDLSEQIEKRGQGQHYYMAIGLGNGI